MIIWVIGRTSALGRMIFLLQAHKGSLFVHLIFHRLWVISKLTHLVVLFLQFLVNFVWLVVSIATIIC